MLYRITRDICSKQLFRRAGALRKFGGAAAGDPSFKNAPGGYPEIKFRKDPDDYVARGNDDEAYFGGRKPGTPLEGWEYIYGAVMLILAGAMISMYNQEDTSLEVRSAQKKRSLVNILSSLPANAMQYIAAMKFVCFSLFVVHCHDLHTSLPCRLGPARRL